MLWQHFFLLITAAFVSGDYCGLLFESGPMTAILPVLALFVIAKINGQLSKRTLLLLTGLFVAIGIFVGYHNRPVLIANNIAPFLDKQVNIVGYIQPLAPIRTERYVRLQLNLEQIEQQSYPQYLVNIYLQSQSSIPQVGTLVQLRAQLQAIHYFNNPSNFNLQEKYYLRNIVGNIYAQHESLHILELPKHKSFFTSVQELSASYYEQLLQIMPAKQASLVQALVLGGSRELPASIWQDFTLTGLIHVLCISGLHTTLVAMLILGICKLLFRNERLAACISIGFVLGYVFLTGFSLPVIRAGIMSILLIAGLLVGRPGHSQSIFGFTLMLMVAFKPNIILELSFQLTFLATGALLFVAPSLNNIISKYINSTLSICLAAVLSVQIVLLPVLINNFHQLSLIAFGSNLLLVPVLELIIVFLIVGSLFIFSIPALGKIFLVVSSVFLDAVVAINSSLAKLPFSAINIPHLPGAAIFLYYLFFYLAIFPPLAFKNINYYQKLASSLFISLLLTLLLLQPQKPAFTQIHFIDVGQGDAALLLSSKNRAILIDTGGLSSNFDIGERVLNPYLRYLGLKQLELLIISHAHFDHAGASLTLSTSFPIKNMLLPPNSASELLDELQRRTPNANLLTAELGSLELDEWQLEILHLPQSDNPNDSLVVKATANNFSALFTADIDHNIENSLLPALNKVDILKVAHHGSANSSSQEFLQITHPTLAVISVGKSNRYQHPAAQTLDRLHSYGSDVLRTDQHGAVVVTLAKDEFYITTHKKELP